MDVVGNPEVIDLLELYLDAARKNPRFAHVAISMVGHPNIACTDFSGDITLEVQERKAVALLDQKLRYTIDSWTFPAQDSRLDASYVRYNIANGPLGFDFLIWLIDAEMTRVRQGAPAPLKVGFWMGHDAGRQTDWDRRRLWLGNVFRPMLPFIGAVEDPHAVFGRCKEVFVPRDIVAAVRNGEKVPRLKSKWYSYEMAGVVTITLREAAHGAKRNSRVSDWLRFARDLRAEGERVIFVRDTAKAHEPLEDFETCPRASVDLDTRLSLYNAAKCNLFVSNGPSGLAMFGNRSFLVFIAPDDGNSDETFNTPEKWKDFNGTEWGEQWPWCRDDQRIVWQADSYDNITAAWRRLIEGGLNGTQNRIGDDSHPDRNRGYDEHGGRDLSVPDQGRFVNAAE